VEPGEGSGADEWIHRPHEEGEFCEYEEEYEVLVSRTT